MHMTQAAQSRSCRWSIPTYVVGCGRVCMPQKVLVGRCHAFAEPLIECESSELDTV